ncbi:MAG: SocA family protein [Bacteroidales bacterium]|nr:SocA family protein [Bacteroidales bacterium]
MKNAIEIEDRYLYRSREVSLMLAAACNQRRLVVNHTKIQKLLFLVYGSYLAVYNKRLTDEHPECWPYGPVFPKLREEMMGEDFSEVAIGDRRLSGIRNDRKTADVIDFVLGKFGAQTMEALVDWCVNSVPCKATPDNGTVISDYVIRDFFNTLIKK